ncbi:hypothetical protein AtDm6_2871 [Acetobacter tropicalis]|uniref:Uncharacterized protein n=1 Tax=Acetobacter tropicalis TaxID=104102 RepID=A0A094YGW8_9PROT|nr:hypothetical protein AtDm6_2871 [Acetobacter tropicalis]
MPYHHDENTVSRTAQSNRMGLFAFVPSPLQNAKHDCPPPQVRVMKAAWFFIPVA